MKLFRHSNIPTSPRVILNNHTLQNDAFFYSFKLWIRFCFPSDKVGDRIISEIEFSCFGDVGYSKVTSTTATKMSKVMLPKLKKKKKERIETSATSTECKIVVKSQESITD